MPMMLDKLFPLAVAVGVLGCAGGPQPTPTTTAPGASATADSVAQVSTAPVVVTLTGPTPPPGTVGGPSAPQPGTLSLDLVVDRRVPMAMPLRVRIAAPEGVRLLSPQGEVVLTATDAARVDHVAIVIEFATIPADDLIATVDGRASDAGFHGEYAYRFGRSGPAASTPTRADSHTVIGGHDLGQAVLVAP